MQLRVHLLDELGRGIRVDHREIRPVSGEASLEVSRIGQRLEAGRAKGIGVVGRIAEEGEKDSRALHELP
jgi:hypothetical protein